MGLFDWLKKRKKNASTVSKGDPSLQAEVNVRPDEETALPTKPIAPPDEEIAEKLRHVGKIVDVARCSGYMEMTLTVLFYNDQEGNDIPVGYFCVQQCSGAYYGAGFRYMLLPKDISEPKAADYVEHDGYSSGIPGYFSEDFQMDIYGKKRLAPDNLPEILRDMSFRIEMKKPGSTVEGGILARFELRKGRDSEIVVSWSVGFGYSQGSYNPGVGRSDPVPAEFFRNHDLNGFARYMVEKYKFLECTADEIFRNQEIWTLFELLREL